MLVSSIEKLIRRFLKYPKDFTWNELTRLLAHLGYIEAKVGKTSGSRCKFFNPVTQDYISLHKPHPSSVLKHYQVKQIIEKLISEGLL